MKTQSKHLFAINVCIALFLLYKWKNRMIQNDDKARIDTAPALAAQTYTTAVPGLQPSDQLIQDVATTLAQKQLCQ